MTGQAPGDCVGAIAPSTLYLTLSGMVIGSDSAGTVDFVDRWGAIDVDSLPFSATGNMDPVSGGHLTLYLWHDVLVSGADLEATVTKDGHLTGHIYDPISGRDPIFTLGACTYPLTGVRVSPAP